MAGEQAGPPALPGADDPLLSEADRHHCASWDRLRPERIAQGRLATALDVLRRWPAAFRYVCRTDAEAEHIARQRR